MYTQYRRTQTAYFIWIVLLEIANKSMQSHVPGTRLNETLTKHNTNDRTEKVRCFFFNY